MKKSMKRVCTTKFKAVGATIPYVRKIRDAVVLNNQITTQNLVNLCDFIQELTDTLDETAATLHACGKFSEHRIWIKVTNKANALVAKVSRFDGSAPLTGGTR